MLKRRTPLKTKTPLNSRSTLKRGSGIRSKPASEEKIKADKEQQEKDWAFYTMIWNKRPHRCSNPECRVSLGNECRTIYNDHILEKSTYPHLRYEERNIVLVCWNCHANKINIPWYKELIKETRELLLGR